MDNWGQGTFTLSVSRLYRRAVRIAHHDHGAVGLVLAPLVRPEIQNVMRVQIAQQRRDHRALHHATFWLGHDTFLPHPSLKPFVDQAEYAPVSYPVFQKAEEPRVAHALEGFDNSLPLSTTHSMTPQK